MSYGWCSIQTGNGCVVTTALETFNFDAAVLDGLIFANHEFEWGLKIIYFKLSIQ